MNSGQGTVDNVFTKQVALLALSVTILGCQSRPDEQSAEPVFGEYLFAWASDDRGIGNAIFDATGVRLHRLPMTPDRVLSALG